MSNQMPRRPWTAADILQLERLRLDGLTAKKIAAAMNRTERAIRSRLFDEGLRRPSADIRWLEVLRGPHRLKEVAAKMGTTVWAVKNAKRRLRRQGFAIPGATWEGPAR